MIPHDMIGTGGARCQSCFGLVCASLFEFVLCVVFGVVFVCVLLMCLYYCLICICVCVLFVLCVFTVRLVCLL